MAAIYKNGTKYTGGSGSSGGSSSYSELSGKPKINNGERDVTLNGTINIEDIAEPISDEFIEGLFE